MTPRYEPGDILHHPGIEGSEFYCLVMDIEIISSFIKNGKNNHRRIYTLLGMDDGEIYRINTENIDCSAYYKKIA